MDLKLEIRDLLWLVSIGVGALISWQSARIRGALTRMDLKLARLELKLLGRITDNEKDIAVLQEQQEAVERARTSSAPPGAGKKPNGHG